MPKCRIFGIDDGLKQVVANGYKNKSWPPLSI